MTEARAERESAAEPAVAPHTPGPWMVTQPEGMDFAHVTDADPNSTAGDLCTVWNVTGNALANARLIAAAPDLLKLAKLLERALVYEIKKADREGDDEGAQMKFLTLADVREVIAKAEGQS